MIVEPQLSYQRSFPKGQLETLLGATMQREEANDNVVMAVGYNSDQAMKNMQAASSLQSLTPCQLEYRYFGLFGRLNYRWKDKYIAI